MGFRKTGIAIDTRVLGSRDGRQAVSGGRPSNPRKGEVYEDLVWDGRAWVSVAVWEARQAASSGD